MILVDLDGAGSLKQHPEALPIRVKLLKEWYLYILSTYFFILSEMHVPLSFWIPSSWQEGSMQMSHIMMEMGG